MVGLFVLWKIKVEVKEPVKECMYTIVIYLFVFVPFSTIYVLLRLRHPIQHNPNLFFEEKPENNCEFYLLSAYS